MKTTKRRPQRLEYASGATTQPVLLVARDDGDGGRRYLATDAILTPPAGALVVVLAASPDGPQ